MDREARQRQKLERTIGKLRAQPLPKRPAPKSEKRERARIGVKQLEKLIQRPGRYGDKYPGLYLQVRSPTNASWLFRYQRDKKERWMGLGSLRLVDREEAVKLAKAADRKVNGYLETDENGKPTEKWVPPQDPIDAKRAARAGGDAVSFQQASEAWLEVNLDRWKNQKYRDQAEQIFRDFVFPLIGSVPVATVSKSHIITVMEQRVPEEQGRPAGPFFKVRAETAKRCRLRLHGVIARAIDIGQRTDKSNPAEWSGLKLAIPKPKPKPRDERHHASLNYRELPYFMSELRRREGVAARALEFTVLTASRTSEAVQAKWSEVNFDEKIWTVPASRMKNNERHTVALSASAIKLLKALPREENNDHIFIGGKKGTGLSNMAMLVLLQTRMGRADLTTHGFRSTFKNWAATTNFQDEVSEHALSHQVGSEVRRAYAREEDFVKRRALMEAWAGYCGSTPKAAADGERVVPIRKRAT